KIRSDLLMSHVPSLSSHIARRDRRESRGPQNKIPRAISNIAEAKSCAHWPASREVADELRARQISARAQISGHRAADSPVEPAACAERFVPGVEVRAESLCAGSAYLPCDASRPSRWHAGLLRRAMGGR